MNKTCHSSSKKTQRFFFVAALCGGRKGRGSRNVVKCDMLMLLLLNNESRCTTRQEKGLTVGYLYVKVRVRVVVGSVR